MPVTTWLLIAAGQVSLALTFALGVAVGIALQRRDTQ